MATIKFKPKGKSRYKTIKSFRTYNKAWNFVADKLMDIDYNLHLSYSVQYLCDGYTKRKVFPFGTNEVSRKGESFKIIP